MLRLLWALIKGGLSYLYTGLLPVWITIKTIGPYKVGAVVLTFNGFLINLYTFSQATTHSNFNLVINAVASTLTGSLNQLLKAGDTLLQGPGILDRIIAIFLIVAAISTWYLWILGWEILKSRLPQTAWYLLLLFSMLVMVWGNNSTDTLFEVFELGKHAAEAATNQTAVNATG